MTHTPIPASVVWFVLERDGHICVSCGAAPRDGVRLVIDHKHPRAAGGSDEPSNLQTLCRRCNAGKGSRLPREMEVAQEAVGRAAAALAEALRIHTNMRGLRPGFFYRPHSRFALSLEKAELRREEICTLTSQRLAEAQTLYDSAVAALRQIQGLPPAPANTPTPPVLSETPPEAPTGLQGAARALLAPPGTRP
jgi:hypothetical protein